MKKQKSIAIIGAGRVGQTLLQLFTSKPTSQHWRCEAVVSRKALSDVAQDICVVTDLSLLPPVDVLLLSVPDHTILATATRLATLPWINQTTTALHFSGASDIQPLTPLAQRGAHIGSLHPVFSFADPNTAATRLAGHFAAIESDSADTAALLHDLAQTLGLQPFSVPSDQKQRYHAALSAASNFTVGLAAYAERLLTPLGLDATLTQALITGLMAQTITNLADHTPADALTGPIVRGDTATVAAHLSALTPNELPLYRACAAELLTLAQPRQTESQQAALKAVLQSD